jgi:hypothetical protein
MDHWVRIYWEERLKQSRIFYKPELRKLDYDYMLRNEATPDWPTFVAKDALYNDYIAWSANKIGATLPLSELYRVIERFLYPYGKNAHTRRSKVKAMIDTGGGRMIEGKIPRAFIKLPPRSVMVAHYNIVTSRGAASEREAFRLEVLNGQQAFK